MPGRTSSGTPRATLRRRRASRSTRPSWPWPGSIQAAGSSGAGGHSTVVDKLMLYFPAADEYRRPVKASGGVYRDYCGRPSPAMTLVGVRDLYDAANGCMIEIDGVACLP